MRRVGRAADRGPYIHSVASVARSRACFTRPYFLRDVGFFTFWWKALAEHICGVEILSVLWWRHCKYVLVDLCYRNTLGLLLIVDGFSTAGLTSKGNRSMRHIYDLRLTSKFILLGLVLLFILALPVALYFQGLLKEGEHARNINNISHAVTTMNNVIKAVQSLRGISTAALNGDQNLEKRLPAAKNAAVNSINTLDAQVQEIDVSSEFIEQWSKIKKEWASLERTLDQKTLTSSDNLLAHTHLIRTILVANDQLLAEHGFSLDPSLDVYSLVQVSLVLNPKLSEALGIMRARGSAFLSQNAISAEDVGRLRNEIHLTRQLQEDIFNHLSRITEVDPTAREVIFDTAQRARSQVMASIELVEKELVNAETIRYSVSLYFDEISNAIEQLHVFNAVAMGQLTALLADRVNDSNRKIAITSMVLLCGLLFAIAFALVIMRSISSPVRQVIQVAESVSQGDLTVTVPVGGTNEFAALMTQMESMRRNLIHLISQMSDSASNVASASSVMAESSQDLSSRTASQAAALEETAASMAQLTVTVRHNADRAQQANNLSESAVDAAGKSGLVVEKLAQTMGDINALSKQIVEIISIIEGIAFQTNMLALNASVEAARAGVQGRGFAIVATEVRALAQRSSSSAREIKDLIDKSVDAISDGYRLATDAGVSMDQTVTSIKHVTDIMAEITLASQEQSIGIEQVNQAVSQMDQTTQQNAEMVEQASDAARSLQQQATGLAGLVSRFRTDSREISNNSRKMQASQILMEC